MKRYSTRNTCNQNLQGLTLSEQFKEIQRQAIEDYNNLKPRVQLNNQTIPENVNLVNEEKHLPRLNDNDMSNNDNRDDNPHLNLRPSDDDIPSILSDGNQNNETENDPENDYKSDEEFEHLIASDKRLKIIRTSLRAVNRKEKFVPDNFQMMDEKIN